MICKQCGNEINPNEKFCGVCGAPNEAAGQPEQSQPVQSAQPAQAQPVQPVQPQPVQPVQPQPAQPAQPQYGQPAQPQYAQPAQPQYGQPVQGQYGANPMPDMAQEGLSKSILTFGILSLVFCMGILGIIFGAISMSKAKNYALSYPLEGRAKTGKILGTIGFIISIVAVVIAIIISVI